MVGKDKSLTSIVESEYIIPKLKKNRSIHVICMEVNTKRIV